MRLVKSSFGWGKEQSNQNRIEKEEIEKVTEKKWQKKLKKNTLRLYFERGPVRRGKQDSINDRHGAPDRKAKK